MEAAASVHSREPTPGSPEVSRIAPESSRRAASGGPFCFLVRGRVAACRLDESLQGSEMRVHPAKRLIQARLLRACGGLPSSETCLLAVWHDGTAIRHARCSGAVRRLHLLGAAWRHAPSAVDALAR